VSLLDRHGAIAFAVEVDRPHLADALLGMRARHQHRVPDPKRERARTVIGTLEVALVVTALLTGPESKAIAGITRVEVGQ
jgi:hypothetical protein